MVGHEGSCAGSYLTDPTSPIPSHCASIVVTSTVRANKLPWGHPLCYIDEQAVSGYFSAIQRIPNMTVIYFTGIHIKG